MSRHQSRRRSERSNHIKTVIRFVPPRNRCLRYLILNTILMAPVYSQRPVCTIRGDRLACEIRKISSIKHLHRRGFAEPGASCWAPGTGFCSCARHVASGTQMARCADPVRPGQLDVDSILPPVILRDGMEGHKVFRWVSILSDLLDMERVSASADLSQAGVRISCAKIRLGFLTRPPVWYVLI
jgi:hypothetical protein